MRSLLLALVLLGAEPKLKPDDWNIWIAAGPVKVQSMTFEADGKKHTASGWCEYTVFVYGKTDTLFYWTLGAIRMNEEAITGGASQDVRVPFGWDAHFDVRIFLTEQDYYGKPFTKQVLDVTCISPLKDGEWTIKPEIEK